MKNKFKRPSRELRRWKSIQVNLLLLKANADKLLARAERWLEKTQEFLVDLKANGGAK